LRFIPFGVPKFEDLGLPEVVGTLAHEERGIILVTGTTGSVKSTTLASMIDLVNRSMPKHIVTVEDPIEFLHQDT
jgi:twitching motility protein PilT